PNLSLCSRLLWGENAKDVYGLQLTDRLMRSIVIKMATEPSAVAPNPGDNCDVTCCPMYCLMTRSELTPGSGATALGSAKAASSTPTNQRPKTQNQRPSSVEIKVVFQLHINIDGTTVSGCWTKSNHSSR